MHNLKKLFKSKSRNLLSIYLTAGYPQLDDTIKIAKDLENLGVDFIELGMPFSDPLADGPTIQETSQIALKNGMDFDKYFKTAREINRWTQLPMVFMGYYNQVLSIGVERFCQLCQSCGISAAIIPDLPLEEYENGIKSHFEQHDMTISFLVTPMTSEDRLAKIVSHTSAFLYVVSDNSITGSSLETDNKLGVYFDKIKALNLDIPAIVGFGIHNKSTYDFACQKLDGAIIGSAFLKSLAGDIKGGAIFIDSIR